MNNNPEPNRLFDPLELSAAVLLGLAAIATAFAGYESSLYDGRSVESYSQSNKLATEAASERSRAVVDIAKDNTVYVEAIRLTLEGDDAPSPTAEERCYEIATYLYTRQMSEAGYKALGLSPEVRKADEDAEGDKIEALKEDMLEKAMDVDLVENPTYHKEMMAKTTTLLAESEKVFKEGQQANDYGDKFQLVAVLYAVSLFFGGIVQVFRDDRMRWAILGAGGVLFLAGTVFMMRIPLIF